MTPESVVTLVTPGQIDTLWHLGPLISEFIMDHGVFIHLNIPRAKMCYVLSILHSSRMLLYGHALNRPDIYYFHINTRKHIQHTSAFEVFDHDILDFLSFLIPVPLC